MSSIAFEEAVAAYDAVDVALDKVDALDVSGLSHGERVALLARRQGWRRRLPAAEHGLLNELVLASRAELGGSLVGVLADRLRIRHCAVRRRIAEAADLGSRRTLAGEPLPAKLEQTAAGQRAGLIGGAHIAVIRGFFANLPGFIDEPTRARAEGDLARVAVAFRPDELWGYAKYLATVLNPDGTFSDQDRARKRGITVGPQDVDGMSRISGYLSPEARAGWDAVAAKWAAPGMCDPDQECPTVAGAPAAQAVGCDVRSAAQRRHDAFNAMLRSMLMSGELGSHQGLPVTIVATVALADLQAKAGVARTGGGSQLPVGDLLRMAAHAYNFLLVFDKATGYQLYKGRDSRLATAAQRLVLYATERGCSHPTCTVPAYWCQVHHATRDWAAGGQTNIDDLTLACGPDNRLVTDGGWQTRKRSDGTTEWIPPPDQDRGQRRTNSYYHPEKMLPQDEEDGP